MLWIDFTRFITRRKDLMWRSPPVKTRHVSRIDATMSRRLPVYYPTTTASFPHAADDSRDILLFPTTSPPSTRWVAKFAHRGCGGESLWLHDFGQSDQIARVGQSLSYGMLEEACWSWVNCTNFIVAIKCFFILYVTRV